MAKGRRGPNEGSIYQRASDNRWCGTLWLGRGEGGKPIRKTYYGETRKEVGAKLDAARRALEVGRPVITERQTVGQFLSYWLDEVASVKLRPLSLVTYRSLAKHHLVPAIGHVQLARLTAQDVQRMINACSTKGLAPRSVGLIREILRSALTQAETYGLVVRNVATLVETPRIKDVEQKYLDPEQARFFLTETREDRLHAAYAVAVWLGLRRGEILGLRWQDLDFAAGALAINQSLQLVNRELRFVEPKTAGSKRVLPLPAGLAAILSRHRAQQAAERLKAGAYWDDHGLVFPTPVGLPTQPTALYWTFKRALKRVGLPDMRFHDLRHSCATLLTAEGVPPRVIMEILGHTTIKMMTRYAHVLDRSKRDAMDSMDRVLAEREQVG